MRSPKLIKSVATGAYREDEQDDCLVRAVSNVAGKSYDEVHNVCAMHGRKDRKGSSLDVVRSVLNAYKFKGLVIGKTVTSKYMAWLCPEFDYDPSVSKTLNSVTKELKAGKYLLLIKSHATALINGGIVDTFDNSAGKHVYAIFWLEDQFESINRSQ